MRKGMRYFACMAVAWNCGALSLFLFGLVGATNIRFVFGNPAMDFFWCCLALSVCGMTGMYIRFDTAEQILWTRRELQALGRWIEIWDITGFFFLIIACISAAARLIDTPSPPFFYTFWMAFASVLLFVPSYVLAVWHMGNMEEYERQTPLNRVRHKDRE